MKVYKFPEPGGRKKQQEPLGAIRVEKPEDEVIGTIYGATPGSKEEWRLAVALWSIPLLFEYQVKILGGWLRGGQVLDFLVYNPFPIPVQVFGEYYHDITDPAELFKLSVLEHYYKREVVIFWGEELSTQERANAVVRERLA